MKEEKRGRPRKPDVVTNLFIGDFQIPEQDDRAINAVLSFIPDLKPDYIHLMGDILDLTKQSSFDPSPYDKHNLMDEIRIARTILKQIVDKAKKANPDVKIDWVEGNHEYRQLIRLSKAQDLADLEVHGENILSIPFLMGLKELGIQWIPYFKEYMIDGKVGVEHGDLARSNSAATATAMLAKRGHSGFSGHTHRLGIHYKTYAQGITKFWVETGHLSKTNWAHPYKRSNDWQQGLALGMYLKETRKMIPFILPVHDNTFYWQGKIYRG